MKMAEGKVPVVEPLRAARLLKRPGEPDWVIEQLKGVLVLSDNRYCIRLPDIRAYADRMGIRISATNAPTVWA